MDSAAKLFRVTHASERSLTDHILTALSVCAVGVGQEGTVLLSDEESRSYGVDPDALAELLRP